VIGGGGFGVLGVVGVGVFGMEWGVGVVVGDWWLWLLGGLGLCGGLVGLGVTH